MDTQHVVFVLLLDLSAALDTIDHKVMSQRLSQDVRVVQQALKWFTSYLSDRVLSAYIQKATSSARPLAFRVPQVFLLRHQLLSIYAAPVANVIHKNDSIYHFYADDSQVYIPVKPLQVDIAAVCIEEIRTWMNFL